MGRPTLYTPELALTICQRLADGESLRSVCRDEAMPGRTAVWQWLDAHPSFANHYARACEMRAEYYVEQAMEIADTPVMGKKTITKASGVEIVEGDMIEHRKLQIDIRKWTAARMAPKRWGVKSPQPPTGDEENGPKLIDPNGEIP